MEDVATPLYNITCALAFVLSQSAQTPLTESAVTEINANANYKYA